MPGNVRVGVENQCENDADEQLKDYLSFRSKIGDRYIIKYVYLPCLDYRMLPVYLFIVSFYNFGSETSVLEKPEELDQIREALDQRTRSLN